MATIPINDMVHDQTSLELEGTDQFDYSKRSQWLRAAILGASDGLVSTASLMMGVGAVKHDIKFMILTGLAGLIAGACSMAIGEFVSVYSQLDIEIAQMKRNSNQRDGAEAKVDGLPSPWQAAAASALAFSLGAMVPLLTALFIKPYKVRIWVVISAMTMALVIFGWLGASLGRAPIVKSSIRVVIGGWMAMAITYGLTRLIGTNELY